MEFRIADTFTDSLARLTGEEQKAVKTTAFDLQTSPGHPSLSFHKLERAKDKRFWSVRVSSIAHGTTLPCAGGFVQPPPRVIEKLRGYDRFPAVELEPESTLTL